MSDLDKSVLYFILDFKFGQTRFVFDVRFAQIRPLIYSRFQIWTITSYISISILNLDKLNNFVPDFRFGQSRAPEGSAADQSAVTHHVDELQRASIHPNHRHQPGGAAPCRQEQGGQTGRRSETRLPTRHAAQR